MDNGFSSRWGKGRFIFFPLMAAAFLALIGYVVMQLWNNLLPAIVDVGPVTFWQAIGLFLLCRILFGFGCMGRRGGGRGGRRFAERFKNMDPEERARFQERCRGHWAARYENSPRDMEGQGNEKGTYPDDGKGQGSGSQPLRDN
jgi:hypothetical protein